MHTTALLIGGNQSLRRSRPKGATCLSRHALIDQATEQIRQRIGSVVALSTIHETEPWGEFEDRPLPFLNKALLVETELSPLEVLREGLEIERRLGRVRASLSTPSPLRKYHSRPMDIDLIFYDDLVMDTPELTLPHPRMHLRRFVLEPLAEIMPTYRHPLLGKTINVLLSELCDD